MRPRNSKQKFFILFTYFSIFSKFREFRKYLAVIVTKRRIKEAASDAAAKSTTFSGRAAQMETSTQGTTSSPSKIRTGQRYADSTVFGLGHGYKKQSAQFTGKQTYLINRTELHQSDASQPLSVSYCLTWQEFASSLLLSSSTSSGQGETAIHRKQVLTKNWFKSTNPVAVVIRQSKAVTLKAGDQTAKTPELMDALAALGTNPTPLAVQTFVETFGDSWVNQVVFGAEYLLVYLYAFTTQKQAADFYWSTVTHGDTVSGPLCVKLLKNQSPGQVRLQLTASLAGWGVHRLPAVDLHSTEQDFDLLIDELQSLFASTPYAEEVLSYECQTNELHFRDQEFKNEVHRCKVPSQPPQMFSHGFSNLDEDVSLF